jgi:hypothetical protein
LGVPHVLLPSDPNQLLAVGFGGHQRRTRKLWPVPPHRLGHRARR